MMQTGKEVALVVRNGVVRLLYHTIILCSYLCIN